MENRPAMENRLAALSRLLEVIDRLRGPGGCPWDRAQTLRDIHRYLLEEVCEAVDAVEGYTAERSGAESGKGRVAQAVCEELGDVLMNIFLAARIAEDEGAFDIAQVAAGISEKLVRRHPHVFGTASVDGVAGVLTNWNAIKEEERRAKDASLRTSATTERTQTTETSETRRGAEAAPNGPRAPRSRLDGVPRSLPALQRAYEISRRAAQAGFDWPDALGALEKVSEETSEVRACLDAGMPTSTRKAPASAAEAAEGRGRLEAELGDLLFAVVNVCRKLEIAPDSALRRTLAKFDERFRAIEARFPDLEKVSLEAMEAVWQDAKQNAKQEPKQEASQEPREEAKAQAQQKAKGPGPAEGQGQAQQEAREKVKIEVQPEARGGGAAPSQCLAVSPVLGGGGRG